MPYFVFAATQNFAVLMVICFKSGKSSLVYTHTPLHPSHLKPNLTYLIRHTQRLHALRHKHKVRPTDTTAIMVIMM